MDIDENDDTGLDDDNIDDDYNDASIDVTGGSIYAGVMASRVTRLQCGILLPRGGPSPLPTPLPPGPPLGCFVVQTTPFPSRLPFKQPVYVW